jgi:DNA-binding CsgD family transcriptional regulator
MARLSEEDLLAVLEVAHEIARVGSRDEFGTVLLRELGRLVRSDVTTLNEIDPAAGRLVYRVAPESFVFPAGSTQLFAELAHQHPLIRHHGKSGDGSAIKVSDFLGQDAWRESELYQRFYALVGVEHQMSITLPAPLPIVVGLAFNRAGPDFGERDRAVLNLVRPHLAQSWRRTREYERLRSMLGAAGAVLSQQGAGVIVLADPVHELTAGALTSLYRFFGRPAPRDALPVRVRHWLLTQQTHLGDSAGLELARPLRASVDGRQLVLRHLPGLRDQQDVILLDERPLVAPTGTLQALGLTDREVVVVRLLGSGASNAEIAQRLSLSPWTVKRHLANIYAKLGVRSRTGASSLVLEIDAHHQT